jgi:chitinase
MKNKLHVLVLFALICIPSLSRATYRVVGYFADWSGNAMSMSNSINYDALTHVNYSFALPNAGTGYISIGNPSLLTNLVSKGHAAGIRVNISLGGAGTDAEFAAICNNNTFRTRMIDSTANFIKKYNLDGLDLDWEFPADANQILQLEALLMDFRIKFDQMENTYGRHIELTVATNGTDYFGKTLNTTATSYLDYINIMSYDGASPHHSSIQYADDCLNYWSSLRGIPASMLVIGVPFYSKYSGSFQSAYRSFSTSDAAGAYNDADGYFLANGYTHDYNSKPVLQSKANLVKNTYQAGGMMIWELTQDRTDQYSLLDAMGIMMGTYVGVNEISKSTVGIESYPNPFSDKTTIDIAKLNLIDDVVQIDILDVTGKIVYSQTHSTKETFAFSGDISQGIYLCKITSSSVIYNVKLVKE